MSRIVACLVGTLMGDAWMCLPALIDICREYEVLVVSGSYALPVWQWGLKYAIGADYQIIRVIEDPDEHTHQFCPGKGFTALNAAKAFVQDSMPHETIFGHNEIGSAYSWTEGCNPRYKDVRPTAMQVRDLEVKDGDHVVVHPYTAHTWKNCKDVIGKVDFAHPVKVVGLAGEFSRPGWTSVTNFDDMVKETLSARAVVGVLSSFTNLAAIFGKEQIIVSFTPDVPINNPRAKVMIEPGQRELQQEINDRGL